MTDLDERILTIQRQYPRHTGPKDQEIWELGITPTQFYQRLNHLTHNPTALAGHAMTLHTYQRTKDHTHGHHHTLRNQSR